MSYAPTSEAGVVLLFGRLAPQLGFCVESVQQQFPDCTAVRRGRWVRIEFEFWASDFAVHGHDPRGADVIICWENDWSARPAKYRRIEIISLRDHVRAAPRQFMVSCREEETGPQLRVPRVDWTVPAAAQRGDLVAIYRSAPISGVRDLWEITGPIVRYAPRNRQGRWPGLQAGMRRLVVLKQPLTFAALSRNSLTRNLPVVRARFQGKRDITNDWGVLSQEILRLNPKARRALGRHLPT
jgi:hypothetical protein